ncbi:hypothetical protein HZ994_14820 [Akkermansiaceae bacterium]|nr:hypothetical protein HZ994_14820 [Akkermansiaceae bacterium]
MKKPFCLLVFTLAACAPSPGPVKRQMIGLLEKFDRWDYNGDGHLTASELTDAERLSGIPVGDVIAFYDTDKDARISFEEAQAGLSRLDEAREAVENLEP